VYGLNKKSEVIGMEKSSSNDSPDDDFWRMEEGISKPAMSLFLVRKLVQ